MTAEVSTPAANSAHVPHSTVASTTILNIGLVCVLLAVPISFAFHATALSAEAPTWLLAIAIIALAIGVPHGAVDHLTLSKELTIPQFIKMACVYVLVAALGVVAIIVAPVPAFVVVLAMTVWHFGTGDLEAMHELQGSPPERGSMRVIHALALGSAPVLLPLTSSASAATLALIEPRLGQMVTPLSTVLIRSAVFAVIALALVMLIRHRRIRAIFELLALTALGCLVSPLLAFAIYFGTWHALRHTARLAQHIYGSVTLRTLTLTFRSGAPSLIGFIVVVAILATRVSSVESAGTWLWLGLAVVWGLTVPHMAMVTAFDQRQRKSYAEL